MNELVVNKLTKSFPVNHRKIKAFEEVDLFIAKGKFITIVGPSGCGKSTLLRCLAGFDNPSSGSIEFEGKPIKKPGKDRMVVFQSFDQLFPWMTVLKNIAYALKTTKIASEPKICQAIAKEYLNLVGLSGYEDFFPHQLSGGMKQRVAIVRALAVKPKILLMDEPFGSLDALTRSILQEELVQIWEKTLITILFVTHSIEEAILLGDEIVVFEGRPGRIKAVIPNELPRPRTPETPQFSELWRILKSHLGLERNVTVKPAPRRIMLIGEPEVM